MYVYGHVYGMAAEDEGIAVRSVSNPDNPENPVGRGGHIGRARPLVQAPRGRDLRTRTRARSRRAGEFVYVYVHVHGKIPGRQL